jgi:catabolite regulation protein CreA
MFWWNTTKIYGLYDANNSELIYCAYDHKSIVNFFFITDCPILGYV